MSLTAIHTKLLYISSDDSGSNSQSSNNFTVNLGNIDGISKTKKIVLKQASIPNTAYNINEYNNRFVWKDNATQEFKEVEFLKGQYTLTKLLDDLNNSVGFGVYGIVFAFDPIIPQIVATASTTIDLLNENDGNPMAGILGITESVVVDTNPYAFKGVPVLSGTPLVQIQSHSLGEANLISSNRENGNIVGVIQHTSPFGGYSHYIAEDSNLDTVSSISRRHGKNISTIDIKILDQRGRLLNLNAAPVYLVFKIYF